ncbi:MAG: adenylate/guanylate cyclase domain-containing protein [Reichenbachiella sp.]
MNRKTKDILKQFILYSIIWSLAFFLLVILRTYGVLEGLIDGYIRDSRITNYGLVTLIFSMGMFSGFSTVLSDLLLGRTIERNKPYGKVLLLKAGFYLMSILVMLGCMHFIFFIPGIYDGHVPSLLELYISRPAQVVALYTVLVTITINFVRLVDDKFGPGNLIKMLFGYYHQPKEVKRIIMFLDLKSSTTAAEKIGDLQYSKMIQECFRDITESVRIFEADIYQYVGDEVILIWKMENGLDNQNCIRMYFHFRDTLKMKENFYSNKFGWIPEFKAGIHFGNVVATEVGFIKREIAYHGDVLNTTSRIQDKCNELGQKLLISKELGSKFSESLTNKFEIRDFDSIDLKGKNANLDIIGIQMKNSQS